MWNRLLEGKSRHIERTWTLELLAGQLAPWNLTEAALAIQLAGTCEVALMVLHRATIWKNR
jgi:hypothetical protein